MIIDDITRDDMITVLEHVQATCACRVCCYGCLFHIPGEGCALAHLPERWKLHDMILKGGDAYDTD